MDQNEGNWWIEETIDDLRASIDRIDTSFMQILSERMRCFSKTLILARSKTGLPDTSTWLEETILDESLGQPFFPSSDFWDSFYGFILKEESKIQKMITNLELPALYKEEDHFDLQEQLENLEALLVKTIVERFRIVWRVGQYKKNIKQEPLAPGRWQQILDDKVDQAKKLALPSDMVVDMFNAIHKEALAIQERIHLETANDS